jgi:hypothetical protein
MMAEAGADVEAGATESGASEPSQSALDADQYDDDDSGASEPSQAAMEADQYDNDDGKILSKGDYGDNSPGKRRHLQASTKLWSSCASITQTPPNSGSR